MTFGRSSFEGEGDRDGEGEEEEGSCNGVVERERRACIATKPLSTGAVSLGEGEVGGVAREEGVMLKISCARIGFDEVEEVLLVGTGGAGRVLDVSISAFFPSSYFLSSSATSSSRSCTLVLPGLFPTRID